MKKILLSIVVASFAATNFSISYGAKNPVAQPKTINLWEKTMDYVVKTCQDFNRNIISKDKFEKIISSIVGKFKQYKIELGNFVTNVLLKIKDCSVQVIETFKKCVHQQTILSSLKDLALKIYNHMYAGASFVGTNLNKGGSFLYKNMTSTINFLRNRLSFGYFAKKATA